MTGSATQDKRSHEQRRPLAGAVEPGGKRLVNAEVGRVGIVLGLVILLVGLVDLAFAWWPFDFGTTEWRFGTVVRTFDGLPLVTVGAAAVLAGLAQQKSAKGLAAFSAAVAIAVVTFLSLAAMFALTMPTALEATPPAVRATLHQALARTAGFMALYIVAYSWMSWFAFSLFNSLRKGRK